MNSLPARSDALLGDRLKALGPARLNGMRRGIEKESLRAQANGSLALTPHPAALGSALTHPSITTDFS
jgi:glutamate--cysteine ligase